MDYIKYINLSDQRYERYDINEKLFRGKHYEVFDINKYEYFTNPEQDYISYDFGKILTNTFCDLIWTEKPKYTFQDSKQTDFWSNFEADQKATLKFRQMTEASSYFGDSIAMINIVDGKGGNKKVQLSVVDPKMWTPIYDQNNVSLDAIGHILHQSKKVDVSDKNKGNECILLEIHTAGQVEYQSYIMNDENEWKRIDPNRYFGDVMSKILVDVNKSEPASEYEITEYKMNTKLTYPMIFHLPNYKESGEFFGASDYSIPIIAKIKKINKNYNQIDYVLGKHAHPKMLVPKELLKQTIGEIVASDNTAKDFSFTSKSNAQKFMRNDRSRFESIVNQRLIDKMEFIGNDSLSGETKYLTWDGNLNESREHIKQLKLDTYEESQLAKVLIDPDIKLGAISGSALKRLAQTTLNKAQKKVDYIEAALKHIIFTILEAQKEWCSGDVGIIAYPDIKFKEGVVDDLKEVIANNQNMLASELTTKIDAIMNVNEVDREQAQIIYDDIQKVKLLEASVFIPDSQNIPA
jgi:hypothetical protein